MTGRISRNVAALLLALAALAGLEQPCLGADWATDLGYPAGKKVIVLHAHDVGLCHASNQAVQEITKAQPKLSASAMAPGPWFLHAVEQSKSSKRSDLGLQLTLNSEWPRYRLRPLGAEGLTSSLRDSRGYMWRSVLQLAVNADAQDVMNEMQAQLLHAERAGMRPTHLTTHLGALYSRPDLTSLYLRFSQKHWIPAVVIDLTPELATRFAADGFPVPEGLSRVIEDYPLPKLRDLRIVPRTETLEEKITATLEMIDNLPSGLTQIAFSPASELAELKALTPKWRQLAWDAAVLRDERVVARLAGEDIVLTNWVEVMDRFDSAR